MNQKVEFFFFSFRVGSHTEEQKEKTLKLAQATMVNIQKGDSLSFLSFHQIYAPQ